MGARLTTSAKVASGERGFAGSIRELDRVRILQAVPGDDDLTVPAGATGTVVAIYADGEAFEVEFTEPVDTLATVEATALRLVERIDG
jgi:hypothetical protein